MTRGPAVLVGVLRGVGLGVVRHSLAGEDVSQLLDVRAGDDGLALLALLSQAVDQLGAQDVDLAVQDPALVADLLLLGGQLIDQLLELLVAQRAEIRKRVHTSEVPCRSERGASIARRRAQAQSEVEGLDESMRR